MKALSVSDSSVFQPTEKSPTVMSSGTGYIMIDLGSNWLYWVDGRL